MKHFAKSIMLEAKKSKRFFTQNLSTDKNPSNLLKILTIIKILVDFSQKIINCYKSTIFSQVTKIIAIHTKKQNANALCYFCVDFVDLWILDFGCGF
ncbi:hypothetical protein [Helicobacter sp. T3_23-1056]